jgi:hypothetical protein
MSVFVVDCLCFSHGFTQLCRCDDQCPASTTGSASCAGGYAIETSGGDICVKFGGALPISADGVTASNMAALSGDQLTVTIDTPGGMSTEVTYNAGAVATAENGNQLVALVLFKSGSPKHGVFFSACGPFIVESTQTRKRIPETKVLSLGTGVLKSAAASGDPHLAGANGITFDVYGKPAANYSLLVAPAFEVNMQLADRGPEMRFMTSMAVLYQGKSFVITPWTVTSSAELVTHFESLGGKVNIDTPNWIITIELCAQHTISFATRNSDGINFLNFEMRVPGCHDAYGGLLGQTYQCKYASEKFEWSREREEAFRVATLETASGMYAPLAECAHEDEYRGEAIRGGSFSNGTLSMTTML